MPSMFTCFHQSLGAVGTSNHPIILNEQQVLRQVPNSFIVLDEQDRLLVRFANLPTAIFFGWYGLDLFQRHVDFEGSTLTQGAIHENATSHLRYYVVRTGQTQSCTLARSFGRKKGLE